MSSTLMTKRQVAELLKFVNDIYPNVHLTQSRIDTWHALLKDKNPAAVMKKAEEYVLVNTFPPSVADLITVKPEKTRDQIEHEKMIAEMGGKHVILRA